MPEKEKKTLIGIDKQLGIIEEWLSNWNPNVVKKGIILYGPPGVGKTSSTYLIAQKLGYMVIEYNTSDNRNKEFMKKLLAAATNSSIYKSVILLDEADGIEDFRILLKVIIKAKKPIILTANNIYRIPPSIREMCTEVPFFRPRIKYVLQVAKQNAGEKKVDYSKLTPDFRQAEAIVYGSEGYTPNDTRNAKLSSMLKSGNFKDINTTDLIFLLDNSDKFYGKDLYILLKAIEAADKCKCPYPLNGIKLNHKIGSSYFYEKLAVARRGDKSR